MVTIVHSLVDISAASLVTSEMNTPLHLVARSFEADFKNKEKIVELLIKVIITNKSEHYYFASREG